MQSGYEDELELIDIWDFIKRQYKTIVVVFTIVFVSVVLVAITRPTLYKSTASLVIGERLFFLQQQQQQLIESVDEIKYKYATLVDITPIKNTRIIEIVATASTSDLAQKNLNSAIEQITSSHKVAFESKRAEFNNLLSTLTKSGIDKVELLQLLDNASNSSYTKQLGTTETKEMRYSGMLLKLVGIGLFAALFFAFLFAVLKDYFQRNKR